MTKRALDLLIEKYPEAVVASHDQHGDQTAIIKPENLLEVMRYLREDPDQDMRMLSDVTGVDYQTQTPRFYVVYHLHSLRHKQRIRIKVGVPDETMTVDSIVDIYPSANWAERETWDMFGVKFHGHPNLKRVLLYEEFEGHPLRKDYPIKKSQPRMALRMGERRDEPEFYPNYGIYPEES